MKHVKLRDTTRSYNEDIDMYRRILFWSGDYWIKCLISFPDNTVEYRVEVSGTSMKVTATARKAEPLLFSLSGTECYTGSSAKEIDIFLEDLRAVRQVYEIIEDLDSRYNTLKRITGSWTRQSVREVNPYDI